MFENKIEEIITENTNYNTSKESLKDKKVS